MARPTIRTHRLLLDDAQAIRALFGSIAHAYKTLGLRDTVDYNTFRAALAWEAVRPQDVQAIEEAWETWKATYLLEEARSKTTFALGASGSSTH